LNEVKNKKIVLQHNDLWFDVKMHCAKSHRPFELFANENCKLLRHTDQRLLTMVAWSWILSLETFFTTCEELG